MKKFLTILFAIIALLVLAHPAAASGIDFDGFPEGTIITDQLDSGSIPVVISASGGSGLPGPVILDSENPPPWDLDLGTPNEEYGGPGVGSGGVGTNLVPLGNLLVVEQDSVDSDGDGIIDNRPNDAVGGTITFTFGVDVAIESITIVDQESSESATITGYDSNGNVVGTDSPAGLGDNSVQVDPLGWTVSVLVVEFTGSGGVEMLTASPTAVTLNSVSAQQDGGLDRRVIFISFLIALAVGGIIGLWFDGD